MEILMRYIQLGFTHVIPFGYDHALFILCISLTCLTWREVLISCSVFTLAHSLSLGLAAARIIVPADSWIEPLIAFTILYSALDNIIFNATSRQRLLTIGMFGLIHGMGFAAALKDAGIPQDGFIPALVSFNVGVELGQVVIIFITWYLCLHWFVHKQWYKRKIVFPVSSLIACVAFFWTLNRLIRT